MDHRFESTAKEAAILILPEGATTEDLLNTRGVRSTISSNAKDWYTYAKEIRGRSDIKKGDIRVVVGIDKVSSWGIATSASNTGQKASYVFKHDPTHAYEWDCTGGSGRVGPQKSEIRDLIGDDDHVPENQCVFVRTINFTFSARIRNEVSSDSAVYQTGLVPGYFDRRYSASGNRGGSKGRRGSSGRGNSSSGHQPHSMQGPLDCIESLKFDPVEPGVSRECYSLTAQCMHEHHLD